MKYFYDTEFLEGTQKKWFGKESLPTIDLISVGVVCEDGREFYAVSKEFNLKEAWNRYDLKDKEYSWGNPKEKEKVYWLRDNVLRPIFEEFLLKEALTKRDIVIENFTYSTLKHLLKKYGKTREEIRWELTKFILDPHDECWNNWIGSSDNYWKIITKDRSHIKPELYGYYSAYDHVCLSWIYGKMIDLPDALSMYTRDLKQMLDEKLEKILLPARGCYPKPNKSFETKLKEIKTYSDYPKQENEHDALADARWNKKLYHFIERL